MTDDLLAIDYAPTPWNDALMGGPTCQLVFKGMGEYAAANDVATRDLWLARRLVAEGYVYVSAAVEAGDVLGKAVLQHLGFDFVYQTTTCVLRLDPTLRLRDAHEGFLIVDPESVAADEVVQVCTATLAHGRFCEDYLTRNEAAPRNAAFLRELHHKAGVHRVFTRAPDGRLNGYAYIPLKSGLADLLMMGIFETAAPPNGGQLFWELCLSELRSKGLARRIQTRVPAANLGVLNIYAKIGFSFIRPSYDFRMFPSKVAG